jgi:hypothetical protein
MLERNGSDESVGGGKGQAPRTREAEKGSRLSVGLKSSWFEQIEKGEKLLDAVNVARQALKNFGDHNASECNRLTLCDRAPQFTSWGARRSAEEIDPNGGVNEYQARFLRMAFRLPFQIPLA